eukprot:COSAG05_NODE_22010_length_267_cov_2.261905_1_plen_57_part_10
MPLPKKAKIPCVEFASRTTETCGHSWGAHILAVNAEGEKEKIEAELWGRVERDPGSS